jgi:hypothetical protein
MVRTILTAAALMAALGGTPASSSQPPSQAQAAPIKKLDPSGIYLCEGTNPDGHKYRGIVQIAAVRGTFLVRWTLADDVEVTGVGILNDDRLSVSYFGGTPAVVVYKIDADKLVGEWTMGGTEGSVYAETLTPMPEGMLKPSPQQQPLTPQPPRERRPRRPTPLPGNSSI